MTLRISSHINQIFDFFSELGQLSIRRTLILVPTVSVLERIDCSSHEVIARSYSDEPLPKPMERTIVYNMNVRSRVQCRALKMRTEFKVGYYLIK